MRTGQTGPAYWIGSLCGLVRFDSDAISACILSVVPGLRAAGPGQTKSALPPRRPRTLYTLLRPWGCHR